MTVRDWVPNAHGIDNTREHGQDQHQQRKGPVLGTGGQVAPQRLPGPGRWERILPALFGHDDIMPPCSFRPTIGASGWATLCSVGAAHRLVEVGEVASQSEVGGGPDLEGRLRICAALPGLADG